MTQAPWRYHYLDHLGSTRRLLATDKSTAATLQFDPYGEVYQHTGAATTPLFTGKPFDATAAMYYFPYRYYNPSPARWLTRDPAGMVDGTNVYLYARAQPSISSDALGLWGPLTHGRYWVGDLPGALADKEHYPDNLPRARKDVQSATNACDYNDFLLKMHILQDYFAHTKIHVTSNEKHKEFETRNGFSRDDVNWTIIIFMKPRGGKRLVPIPLRTEHPGYREMLKETSNREATWNTKCPGHPL